MLHIVYILAFTVIAFIAISNLIRSLITVSTSDRRYGARGNFPNQTGGYRPISVPHPELLDESGNPVKEPLLVMRSVSVEDARQKLDAIYNASPSQSTETDEEV